MADLKTIMDNNLTVDIDVLYYPPNTSRNHNKVIILTRVEDYKGELGIQRTHYDQASVDMYVCEIVEGSESLCETTLLDVRKVCREFTGDDDYALISWQGGRWGGRLWRKIFIMTIICYKVGLNIT